MDRILFIPHNANAGGATFLLLDFIRYYKQHSKGNIYVLLENGGPLTEEFGKVTKVISGSFTYFKGTNRVIFLLNRLIGEINKRIVFRRIYKLKPTAVYINTLHSSYIDSEIFEHLSSRFIVHIHEMDFIQKMYLTERKKVALKKASKIIAVSRAVKESLINNVGVEEDLVSVIYGSLPKKAKSVDIDVSLFRNSLGLKSDDFVVLGIGSPGWIKGSDIFLSTAIQVHKNNERVKFLWVGGDPNSYDFKTFKYEIDLAKASSYVKLISRVDDTNPFYKISNLFFLSSRQDSFPLVALEAGYHSLPVVCFDVAGGCAELLDDGGGKAVDFCDIAMVSELVMMYMNNKSSYEKERALIKSKVIDQYMSDKSFKEIKKLIEFECQK